MHSRNLVAQNRAVLSMPVVGNLFQSLLLMVNPASMAKRLLENRLVVSVLVVLAIVSIILARQPRSARQTFAPGSALQSPGSGDLAEIPEAKFKDITAESGIRFVHNNGAYGEKLLPETMGGGVAFLDFDNDGAQDLLFVNSTYWPGKVPAGKKATTLALYRNDGKGHFQDVTSASGLDVSFYGMGVAVGDYDN